MRGGILPFTAHSKDMSWSPGYGQGGLWADMVSSVCRASRVYREAANGIGFRFGFPLQTMRGTPPKKRRPRTG